MWVVCGEALFDLFVEPGGPPFRLEARIGGSPFNVAVGIARLGGRAALMTGIAGDLFGRALRAALAAEGVETGLLVASPRKTTLALAAIGPEGGAEYAFYGEDGADRWVSAEALPALPDAATGLHFGSYTTVAEPVASAHLALARREAGRRTGRRIVSYDANVRPTVEPDMGLWRRAAAAMAEAADIVKLSDEDAARLWPGEAPEAVLGRFRAAGAALAVMTLGSEGALALGAFGRVAVPGVPVTVADTVGAGDAFQAALLAGISARGLGKADLAALDAATARDMLGFAARAAAVTCSRRGADLPRLAEVA